MVDQEAHENSGTEYSVRPTEPFLVDAVAIAAAEQYIKEARQTLSCFFPYFLVRAYASYGVHGYEQHLSIGRLKTKVVEHKQSYQLDEIRHLPSSSDGDVLPGHLEKLLEAMQNPGDEKPASQDD